MPEFRLPDLGEGLTEGEILTWRVAVGDEVAVNQPLVEVETAKAAVEIPSPFAGVVVELHAEEGDVVPVGAPLVSFSAAEADAAVDNREPVLVGYGPREQAPRRRRRTADVPAPTVPGDSRPRAKPPVRKLARDLGVDLATLHGSGPDGIITRVDVERARASSNDGEQRIAVRGLRRATAEAMVASAFSAPQATVWTSVDVTETMRLRSRLAERPEFAEVRLTPLAFVAKALLLALHRHPLVNSRWDGQAGEIVVAEDVGLGIAVATERGLLVPKIHHAQRRTLTELAGEIGRLADEGRAGRLTPADLTGGTVTITNVGVFGADGGTPILTPGESAILCLGAVRERPWVVDGALAVRSVVELTLGFDHRVLDGQQAAQCLNDIASVLADPALALAR